jgi:hypothetical protein
MKRLGLAYNLVAEGEDEGNTNIGGRNALPYKDLIHDWWGHLGSSSSTRGALPDRRTMLGIYQIDSGGSRPQATRAMARGAVTATHVYGAL